MKLKFSKKNATRWNSVLFMVRSVLKATPQQLQYIQSQMPSNSQKAKQARREFQISSTERVMLLELKELLELFEIATNELQSNEVSISRVFPSINSLIINLSRNINDYTHTKEMRNVTYF
jgi:Tfp pilus assembly PilM family ATPase